MYQITLNSKWCKSCGLCADFCPKNVFDFTSGCLPVIARAQACTGCKICELKCPELALCVEVKS